MTASLNVLHGLREFAEWTNACRRRHETIGLVPTMGALHEGHLSLVRAARKTVDKLAVSIFVNPTQFGPGEDLAKYPQTLQLDLDLLAPLNVDAVFAPQAAQMYPVDFSTYVEPAKVATLWEGAIRPTHFRGVTTVVLKLLLLSQADRAFFGQKDYQQFLVVRSMVRDLNVPCQLTMSPTVREADGLAMSSRNRYLSDAERQTATWIFRTLDNARKAIEAGERDGHALSAEMNQSLIDAGFDSVDYAAICDRETLAQLDRIRFPAVLLVAARLGTTRLIDNMLVGDL